MTFCLCHLSLHGLPLFSRKFLISVGSDCKRRITARPQDGGGLNLPSPPLRLSVFLTVRLTPHCLPWFSPPLPLTIESCLSSNVKRMRIGLSSYLKTAFLNVDQHDRTDGSRCPSDRSCTLSPLRLEKRKS